MLRLNRQQLREIDRRSLADYHIPTIVLMENAARAVADEAVRMIGPASDGQVLILCGGGNNGGDGLAVARHLHNRQMKVEIALLVDPAKYVGDALINWQIVTAMKLTAQPYQPAMIKAQKLSLIIDAVFGTGLSSAPREPFPALAEMVNNAGTAVLAVDLPSGLDCNTGRPPGACIHATRTVTFVAEKIGFTHPRATEVLGTIVVADIGCPRELILIVSSE